MLCPACQIESLRRLEGDALVYRCRNKRCRMHGQVISSEKLPEKPMTDTINNEVTEEEA